MTRKKRFGISEALTRGLSETIGVVENNAGTYRNVVMPLSRVELDPDNPRKLAITLEDVRHGLSTDDPAYSQKQDELERLKELAHTIKSSGVINPVVVYKNGEHYRVVAGERRCLAATIAGLQEIEARVFHEKPKGFNLKLVQWIENTAREDLNLDERLGNVKEILDAYVVQHKDAEVTATLLKNITGLSLSQSTYYLAVLKAPKDVAAKIKEGSIRNLDKAALLSGINNNGLRQSAIDACLEGASIKSLRQIVNQHKVVTKKVSAPVSISTRGRVASKVNMGSTQNTKAVKEIVDCVLAKKDYDRHAKLFNKIDWSDYRQASKGFKKLLEIMETEVAV